MLPHKKKRYALYLARASAKGILLSMEVSCSIYKNHHLTLIKAWALAALAAFTTENGAHAKQVTDQRETIVE